MLGQLGARVQHALRAFTPDDAKDLRATVSTYPRSEFYDLEALLTSLGIGEAAVTLLSETGVPTPVVHTRLVAPASRMGPADDVDAAARRPRCGRSTATGSTRRARASCWPSGSPRRRPRRPPRTSAPAKQRPAPAPKAGTADAIGDFLRSSEGKRLQKSVTRGVLGMLRKRL